MMKGQQTYMFHLKNGIRAYHWGSTDAITQLLGHSAEITPQAELWLGAHPGNPSQHSTTGQGLDVLIEQQPVEFLGQCVSSRFGQLPFLMKVLAASQPLSIQVHPSLVQAREGYQREDAAGIDRAAAQRNYKDDNHKPEMLYALGDFVALSGFRTPAQILADLAQLRDELSAPAQQTHAALVQALSSAQQPLGRALELVLTGGEPIHQLCEELVSSINAHPALREQPQLAEVAWAAQFYPKDPGVLVALLMNVVRLQAGEAISLGAGKIHAYLRGVGIEVMANSDNVLRGGLTSKHIDVPELLAVTITEPGLPERLTAHAVEPGNKLYTPDFDEFQLQVLESSAEAEQLEHQVHCSGGAIALCTAGSFVLIGDDEQLRISRGESVFLPAAGNYRARATAAKSSLFIASASAQCH